MSTIAEDLEALRVAARSRDDDAWGLAFAQFMSHGLTALSRLADAAERIAEHLDRQEALHDE